MQYILRKLALPLGTAVVAAGALLTLVSGAWADYPDRAIRIIVPTAAGSSPDVMARLIQPHLEQALGQPIVVENRPGGGTMVGTELVARADPDGYTLVVVPTTFTVNAALVSDLPFDPAADFEPIAVLATNPLVFAINADVPAETMDEFIELAKARRGELNFATPGPATQAHLLIEMWSDLAGVSLQHVPYAGGAPAILSVTTGETQLTLMSTVAVLGQVEAGTIRPLAIGSSQRDPKFPDLPTLAEAGFSEVVAQQWFGLLAPGGTPDEIVQKLNAVVNDALSDSDVLNQLELQGQTPGGGTPDDFRQLIASEIQNWERVAQQAGVTVR